MRNLPVIEHFLRLTDEEHQALFERMQEETGMTLVERFTEVGKQQGIEQGIEQGAKQARREDARKMLELGAELDFIEKVTSLSREEIEALRD